MLGPSLNIPVIQLLVTRWYPGSPVSVAEARDELQRRGWSRARQFTVLALLVPLIAPDRFMHRLDVARDDFEEAGTPREVAFSALFSISMVSLVSALISGCLIISRHDSGQPYQWRWLLGWSAMFVIFGRAASAVARHRA